MVIDKPSFYIGAGLVFILATVGVLTGITVYQHNKPPFQAITLEIATLIVSETRKHCSKTTRRFKAQADGLTVSAGCVK